MAINFPEQRESVGAPPEAITEIAFTPTPNVVYDYWLGVLEPAQFVVLSYILRQTLGWHRPEDMISFKQLAEGKRTRAGDIIDRGCGLTNFTAIKRALDALIGHGLIERVETTTVAGGKGANSYRLIVHKPITQSVNTPITPDVNTPLRPAQIPHYAARITPITPRVNTKERDKETSKENLKKEVGADAPAAPETEVEKTQKPRSGNRVRLAAISTADDTNLPASRRLSLKLARDVFKVKTSSPDVLARYDGYFDAAATDGYSVDDCRRFLCWLASNEYWGTHAYQFTSTQFSTEWADWVGRGKPLAKPKAATGRKPTYQGLGGAGDGRRAWKPCCPLCGAEVGTTHNIKDPLKIGVHCSSRIVTTEDVERTDSVAS